MDAGQRTDRPAGRIDGDQFAHSTFGVGAPCTVRRDRAGCALRFLEKTPKNVLRIPFIERIFPDALYVFLWRDPRGNLASIMEAW